MPIDPSVIQNIGRNAPEPINPLQTLAQVYQLKHLQQQGQLAQQEGALRQQEFGLRQQEFQTKQAAAQRKQGAADAMNALMAQGLPKTASGDLDLDTLEKAFVAKGYGLEWVGIKDNLQKGEVTKQQWQEGQLKTKTAFADLLGFRAAAINQLKTPEERQAAYLATLGDFSRDGIMPPDRAQQMKVGVIENPATVEDHLASAIRNSPALQEEARKAAAKRSELRIAGDTVFRETPEGGINVLLGGRQHEPELGTFGDFLNSYAKSQGKNPRALPPAEILAQRRLWEAANDTAKAAVAPLIDPTIAQSHPALGLMAINALAPVRGKDQKAGFAQAINAGWAAGEEPYKRAIRNTVIANLNVDDKKVVSSRGEAIRAMTAFQAKLAEVPTGLVAGTAEKTIENLTGQPKDPKLAQLRVELENALITWRRAQTGAQFSMPEDASYRAIWPQIDVSVPLNLARVGGLIQGMRRNSREFWEQRFGPEGADYLGATDPDAPGLGSAKTGQTLPGPGLGPGNTTLTPGAGPTPPVTIRSITPVR